MPSFANDVLKGLEELTLPKVDCLAVSNNAVQVLISQPASSEDKVLIAGDTSVAFIPSKFLDRLPNPSKNLILDMTNWSDAFKELRELTLYNLWRS